MDGRKNNFNVFGTMILCGQVNWGDARRSHWRAERCVHPVVKEPTDIGVLVADTILAVC